MISNRRASVVVGVAAVLATALGSISALDLFHLCTVGVISGPMFAGVVAALAALLAGGIRLLFTREAQGRPFILAAVLLGFFVLSADAVLRTIPLELAAIASLLGTAFSLWRLRRKWTHGVSEASQ